MNLILLVISIIILLFSLRQMTIMETSKKKSIIQEIKKNIVLLIWGIPLILALVFIPYQVWILAGKSNAWDGVYVISGTAFLTIIISFIFYYKNKVKSR